MNNSVGPAEHPPFPEGPELPPPRTSASAVWALVTGLLCVPVVPIVLGIVGLTGVNRSGGRLKGGGLALAGIILGCLQVFVIPVLAGLLTPAILRAKKSADLTMATNSLRNLGVVLSAFEADWGSFPSGEIRRRNPERFAGARPGDSANAMLSMLVAGGYVEGESLFREDRGHRADDVTAPPARLLEPGECLFGYVMLDGGRAMSAQDNGGRPLLVAPLQAGAGGANPPFDPQPYGRRGVFLCVDQSVNQGRIDASGRLLLPAGTALFETGPDTVWGDESPDVRPPE